MTRAAKLLLVLALAGCAAPPAPEAELPPIAEADAAPASPPPVSVAPPPFLPPPPPDTCGARELRYLIGKPRNEIPVPINPGGRRVTCTTCPMTMDFNPARLNILFDADTGIIREVKCG